MTDEKRGLLDALEVDASQSDADRGAVTERLRALFASALAHAGGDPAAVGPLIGEFWGRQAVPGSSLRRTAEAWPDVRALVTQLPYPLGGRYRSFLAAWDARDSGPDDAFAARLPWDLCAVVGIVLRLDAAMAIAAYIHGVGGTDAALNRMVLDRLRAPSDGAWLELTQRLTKACREASRLPHLDWIHACLRRRTGIRGASSVREALEQLVAFRNRLVHGDEITDGDVRGAVVRLEAVVACHDHLARLEVRARVGDRVWSLVGQRVAAVHVAQSDGPDDGEVALIVPDGSAPPLPLSPLLHFRPGDPDDPIGFDELFFLNAGALERLRYVAYRFPGELDGALLGGYEEFRRLVARLPAPPIAVDPRLDDAELVAFHERTFVGRDDVIEGIDRFIAERPAAYGIVRARAGFGKTALLAHLYSRRAEGDRWAFHFCATREGRDSPVVALRSLVAQVCDAFDLPRDEWLTTDLDELRERLVGLLNAASARLSGDERLVIAVDALDEGIPASGVSVPAALPAALPERVVGLLTMRVGLDGRNQRVRDELAHMPDGAFLPLPGANPLAGLERRHVAVLLERTIGADVPVPTESLDAVWDAATRDTTDGAEPVYVRFLVEEAEARRVDLRRPESIPTSLDELLQSRWMTLPTDHGFFIHRLLGLLAVMPGLGDDELFADLLSSGEERRLTPEDVAIRRRAAAKLLLYDAERYTLHHDRLRQFLIGRFRPREVASMHGLIVEASEAWDDPRRSTSLRNYCFRHGVGHALTRGEPARAQALLGDLSYHLARAAASGRGGIASTIDDVDATARHPAARPSPRFDAWRSLFLESGHILRRGDDPERCGEILFQLAFEHGRGSEVSSAAERWLAEGGRRGTWLARASRRPARGGEAAQIVLEGHGGGVVGARLLDDGRLLSWSRDGTLRVWSPETGACLLVLEGHRTDVLGALELPAGGIVSWSADGTLRAWDLEDETCRLVLDARPRGEPVVVEGAILLRDGRVASWCSNGVVTVWDPVSGARVVSSDDPGSLPPEPPAPPARRGDGPGDGDLERDPAESGPLRPAERHPVEDDEDADRIHVVAELPDGRLLVVSREGAIAWNLATGVQTDMQRVVSGALFGPIEFAAYTRDERLVTATGSRIIVQSDLASDGDWHVSRVSTMREGSEALTIAGVEPLADGHVISWSALEVDPRLWTSAPSGPGRRFDGPDFDFLLCVGHLDGHARPIAGARGLDDGRLITWSKDATIRIWSLTPAAERFVSAETLEDAEQAWALRAAERAEPAGPVVLEGHADDVTGALILPDGRLASWSRDRTIRLWDIDREECTGVLGGHAQGIDGVLVSGDGERLVSWSHDEPSFRLWRLAAMEASPSPAAAGASTASAARGVRALADDRVASWHEDRTLRLWDVRSGAATATCEGHGAPVKGVIPLHGGRVLSWSRDKTLRSWSVVDSSADTVVLAGAHRRAIDSALELDDGRIVSWDESGAIALWTVTSDGGASFRTLAGHTRRLADLRPLSGGRIASASWDGTARIWAIGRRDDELDGAPSVALEGHEKPVSGVLELAGRIVTSSWDGTVRTWAHDGRPETTIRAHASTISGWRALDDRRVVTWSDDATAAVIDVVTGAVEARVEHDGAVRGVAAIGPDQLVSWGADGAVRRWSLAQEPLETLRDPSGAAFDFAVHVSPGITLGVVRRQGLTVWRDGEIVIRVGASSVVVSSVHRRFDEAIARRRWSDQRTDDHDTAIEDGAERATGLVVGLTRGPALDVFGFTARGVTDRVTWHADTKLVLHDLLAPGAAIVTLGSGDLRVLHLRSGEGRTGLAGLARTAPATRGDP